MTQTTSANGRINGLSFGVLKEQEFEFRSKLVASQQHDQPQISQNGSRHRANSLPAQKQPPPFARQPQQRTTTYAGAAFPAMAPPAVYTSVPHKSQPSHTYFSTSSQPYPVSAQASSSSNCNPAMTTGSRFSFAVGGAVGPEPDITHRHRSSLHTIHEDSPPRHVHPEPIDFPSNNNNNAADKAQHGRPSKSQTAFRDSPCDFFPTPQVYLPSTISNRQQRANFMNGDPYSDRLAEFVSKMVFIIFWQGSDSFSNILETNTFAPGNIDIYLTLSCFPSFEFISYTKFLLETMQVSCSTAILSLFYLHRLRPRVKHLFIPGTFDDHVLQCNGGGSGNGRFQYRRDPKLEYRLFTVALILANKYLDDNSYSNKAWSDVTGLHLRKVNIMELEFMKYIEYTLLVKEREYVYWVRWLETFIRVLTDNDANPTVPVAVRPVQQHFLQPQTPNRNLQQQQVQRNVTNQNISNMYQQQQLPTPRSTRVVNSDAEHYDHGKANGRSYALRQPQQQVGPVGYGSPFSSPTVNYYDNHQVPKRQIQRRVSISHPAATVYHRTNSTNSYYIHH